jgi:hypothetical protein
MLVDMKDKIEQVSDNFQADYFKLPKNKNITGISRDILILKRCRTIYCAP